MPYVNIKLAKGATPATPEQKTALIKGVTDLLQEVMNKKPASTYVIIEEVETDNWGVGGESITSRNARTL